MSLYRLHKENSAWPAISGGFTFAQDLDGLESHRNADLGPSPVHPGDRRRDTYQ